MQRRQFLSTLGATAATISAPSFFGPLSFGDPNTLTGLATTADLESYGADGNPSFILRYADADHREDLQSFVESTDGGQVIRDLETANMMTVSVPWEAAGRTSTFGIRSYSGGFEDLDYLEYADANTRLSLPEPIAIDNLASASDFDVDLRLRDRASMALSLGSTNLSQPTDGLAFDGDAVEATLREARQLVRAGDSVINSVDTSGVTVTVIDTGANDGARYDDADGNSRIHPESTNFTASSDPTVGTEGVGTVEAGDSSEHGDWVSSCILADHSDPAYRGFAPEAELVVAKSLDDSGGGAVGDIIAGVDLAISVGADVICMSLGSPQWSESLADALAEAWENGAVPVVATGNDRYGTTFVAAPASAVSSDEHPADGFAINACNVPESGERDDTLVAYFGNVAPAPGTQDLSEGDSQGARPTLLAPGMAVDVGPAGVLTGTSMAAPMVAGAAAVLAGDGHDNETILERLTACAYPLASAGETEAGHGLLDLEAALANSEYGDSQKDVRSDAARVRDDFNRALSETRGRTFAGLF